MRLATPPPPIPLQTRPLPRPAVPPIEQPVPSANHANILNPPPNTTQDAPGQSQLCGSTSQGGLNIKQSSNGVSIEALNYGKASASISLPPDPTESSSDGPNLATMSGAKTSFFDSFDDRTNVDALYSHFMLETMMADWVDVDGNPAEPASAEEASAIITTVIESLYKASASNESFLINVAALAGGKMLMTTSRLRLARLQQLDTGTLYTCTWEYRLGALRGTFSMTHEVSYDLYRPENRRAAAGDGLEGGEEGEEEARYWQKKYEELAKLMRRKDQQILELKRSVVSTLKEAEGP